MIVFLTKFLYVIEEKKAELLLMFFLFLFVSALEVFSIGIVGPFVTIATNTESIIENPFLHSIYEALNFDSPVQFLIALGILLIIAFYGKAILAFSIQKRIFEFGFYLRRDLTSRLMKAYLSAPYTFHLASNSAVLINNAVDETKGFCTELLMPLLTSVSNALIVFSLVILLMKTDLLATVLISTVLIVAFSLFGRLKGKLYQWGMNASNSNADIIRSINHGLGGIKETRVIGCENYFLDQLDQHATFYAANVSAAVSFNNLPRFMIEALLMTFLVGFTSLFVLIHQNSGNLVSVLGIFALSSIRLMPAAANLFTAIGTIRANTIKMDRIYLDLKQLEGSSSKFSEYRGQDFEVSSTRKQTLKFRDKIALKFVKYRYPNASEDSLKGVSLTIRKGESIGLIGKSGAGKTSLVDVILGLLTPQEGEISVDGVPVHADLRSWQNMLGYVPQSIFLIDDTLEHNIAFGVPDHLIDREKVSRAVQTAQLTELVERLPKGLQTEVGERGVLLSGGQRQRIGIARAIYHERDILIFDEATAALDNETEQFVTEAIKALSGIKTMIIIAHRLSTLEHCDRIYEMKQGQVVRCGSYQEIVLNEQPATQM